MCQLSVCERPGVKFTDPSSNTVITLQEAARALALVGNCSGVHLQDLMCYENGIPQHKFSRIQIIQ